MKQSSNRRAYGSLLSIGQVAKRSGVAASALRYYEAEGLISSLRNPGGQRRYNRDVLRRVAIIKTAQHLGMPLKDIKAGLDSLPSRHSPGARDWKQLSARWMQQLNARIQLLIRLRDQLDDCIGCGCLSLASCPLRNPDDIAAEKGPGALLFQEPGR